MNGELGEEVSLSIVLGCGRREPQGTLGGGGSGEVQLPCPIQLREAARIPGFIALRHSGLCFCLSIFSDSDPPASYL